MLVATVEDLQGSVEVVVFPKVFEQTAPAWTDDSVILVSGRVDHRDETAQLLCEAVWAWDDAVRMGPVAFAGERDRMQRARANRGSWGSGGGNGNGNGGSPRGAVPVQPEPPVAVPVEVPVAVPAAVGLAGAADHSAPAAATLAPEVDDAPAPTDAVPIQSAPVGIEGTVEVGFEDGTPADRIYAALEAIQGAIRGRPGPLPVVIGVPGATWQVKLPERVAWDERLPDALRRAAGVTISVELRSTPAAP
jgi:hypothetical protein